MYADGILVNAEGHQKVSEAREMYRACEVHIELDWSGGKQIFEG